MYVTLTNQSINCVKILSQLNH